VVLLAVLVMVDLVMVDLVMVDLVMVDLVTVDLVNLDRQVERVALAITGVGTGLAVAFSLNGLINSLVVRRARNGAPTVPALSEPGGERLSVLIPARNEALRIGPTIASVLSSDGIAELEVLVLDDHSTDNTAGVVRHVARNDARLRIISGETLPEGWMGKPWACEQLGRIAAGSILIFVDADVVLEPSALRATVDLLNTHDLSLVSPYPKQLVGSIAERVVQPLLQWLWLSFLPLRLAERSRPVSMAAANGQLLAVTAEAWRSVGGHGSVRNEVIEDVALAKAFKSHGFRATVAEGSQVVSCRMYSGCKDLSAGYTKSLWAALPSRRAARVVGGMLAVTYLVPPVSAVAGLVLRRDRIGAIGLVGYAAGVVGRLISAHTTGGSKADCLAHPLSIGTLMWLGSQSWRKLERGELQWKGRAIHGR
jgi:hypothetical protein